MKKIDWKCSRKWGWPLNVICYNFQRLFPGRDKNIWVFGGREGHQYDDNSRYLFEYVNKNHPEINSIWLCEKEDLAMKVRNLGYQAYTFNSKDGKRISKKAGVAIYSHGLIDFGIFPKVGGALIVSLWHGVGFKKIYNDTYHGFYKSLKRFMDVLFSWTWRDLTIVTSEYTKKQFAGIFNIPEKNIVIAGQPRNDIFKQKYTKEEVLKNVDVDFNKNIILYMPTYRGFNMGKDAMENIVRGLYESEILAQTLDETNSVLIAKLHPLTPHIDIRNRKNFVILDYGAVDDNQALLAVSDMMVTDYSSCFVDFALRNRPVVFYMPDLEVFINQAEPLYDEFFEVSKHNRSENIEELCNEIKNPSNDANTIINEYFEDPSIKGTCYSENVFNAIIHKLNK